MFWGFQPRHTGAALRLQQSHNVTQGCAKRSAFNYSKTIAAIRKRCSGLVVMEMSFRTSFNSDDSMISVRLGRSGWLLLFGVVPRPQRGKVLQCRAGSSRLSGCCSAPCRHGAVCPRLAPSCPVSVPPWSNLSSQHCHNPARAFLFFYCCCAFGVAGANLERGESRVDGRGGKGGGERGEREGEGGEREGGRERKGKGEGKNGKG